jgi:hypothetical protein
MFIGIGGLLLAVLVLIALFAWRRRQRPVDMGAEQEFDETGAEFTWEAQVNTVFTEGATYENPGQTGIWESDHFSQVMTARDDDDPFTQFE